MIALHDELQVEHRRVEVGVLVPSSLKECFLEASVALTYEDLRLLRKAVPLSIQGPLQRVLSIVS